MNALTETQKKQPAQAGESGKAAVEARAQFALEVTPKRFRLIVGAVFSLPLRLFDVLRDLLRSFF